MIFRHLAAICLAIALLLPSAASAEKGIESNSRTLSSSQIMRISGEAGLSDGTYYAGKLFNGNRDIFVTEVSVYVRAKREGEVFPRLYFCKVRIPPLSSSDFGFDIIVGDEDSDYAWGIFEAKGYKVE